MSVGRARLRVRKERAENIHKAHKLCTGHSVVIHSDGKLLLSSNGTWTDRFPRAASRNNKKQLHTESRLPG